ncbi:hypothetical protein V5799_017500 [Amblyomma americanum]|uniref:Uncharacterized protein n=1 Tax=Amblyomma americanum TaxID=6943 RepID=A0AAQ4F2C4_AMBAM
MGRRAVQCLAFHYSHFSHRFEDYSLSVTTRAASNHEEHVVWSRSSRELVRDTWTGVNVAFKMETDSTVSSLNTTA